MHPKNEPLSQPRACLTLDRATVIPLDQASILLSGPCQSPSHSPRGLWVMAFDWFPGCICCLCLNLAGEMRPRISKGVIQATLSHGGHDRNPLGRKNQMLGRKEANRSFPSETAFSSAAAKSLQSCLTLCDPIDGIPPGSPSLGFSRQEHWSGLPFPSPMCESEK